MGTSFKDIYKRAVTELKDPTLKKMYENDIILYFQVMNNFLNNAIPMFTNPLKVRGKLSKRVDHDLFETSFISDGFTDTFSIDEFLETHSDTNNMVYSIRVDGVENDSEFVDSNNSIYLYSIPPSGSTIEIRVYYIGSFIDDLLEGEQNILSQFLCVCWVEYITNDKLDNIRILTDTDFKLPANSTTTQAKVSWYVVSRENATKEMNKYAWDSHILGIYR